MRGPYNLPHNLLDVLLSQLYFQRKYFFYIPCGGMQPSYLMRKIWPVCSVVPETTASLTRGLSMDADTYTPPTDLPGGNDGHGQQPVIYWAPRCSRGTAESGNLAEAAGLWAGLARLEMVRGGWHLHICTLAPEVMLMSTAIASCTERENKKEINQLLAKRGREYASREAETKNE